jgi:hypothetical protein
VVAAILVIRAIASDDEPASASAAGTTTTGTTSVPTTTAPGATTTTESVDNTRPTTVIPGEASDPTTAALQTLQTMVGDGARCVEYDWQFTGELATLYCSALHGFDAVYYSLFADAAAMQAGFEASVFGEVPPTQGQDCANGEPAVGSWGRGRFACFWDPDQDARAVLSVDELLLVIDGYTLEGTIADVDRAVQTAVVAVPRAG